MLQKMINGCIENDAHIPVLYGKYVERCESLGKFKNLGLSVEDLFKSATSMKSIDESWLIAELKSISDMTADDILHCTKYDDDAVLHLVNFAASLGSNHKLHQDLQIKNVFHRLFVLLDGQFGGRLNKLEKEWRAR